MLFNKKNTSYISLFSSNKTTVDTPIDIVDNRFFVTEKKSCTTLLGDAVRTLNSVFDTSSSLLSTAWFKERSLDCFSYLQCFRHGQT